MILLHRLASVVRWIFRRDKAEAELRSELEAFADMAAADHVRDGATPDQARRLAALQLGGFEQVKERVRAGRHGAGLDTVARDLRYGLRQLRRSPGFSTIAIATLALGIGGITAMFSAFDAVLIRPMPFAEPDRLVMIWDDMTRLDITTKLTPSPAEWLEWRRLNTVFTDLAITQAVEATVSGDGDPEQVPARSASWTFWSVLGVRPAAGRVFTEDEDSKAVKVVVISHGLWQRRFGGRPEAIGRTMSINDERYEVIGIMPPTFYFLPARDVDLWVPASMPAWMRTSFGWHSATVVARLKPGISLVHARDSMRALSLQISAKDLGGGHPVLVIPLREEIAGRTRTALTVLLWASATLLVIACVNLTNLLLSRGAARRREVAVRTALGAGRGRLVRQFLTESLTLAALGALAGVALALPAIRFLERLVPEAMGDAAPLRIDWRVLLFSTGVAAVAAVGFGLVPALRGSRFTPQEAMRAGGRGSTGPRSHWFQHSLIVVETALAVALLICGGLLLQTYHYLRHTDVGMRSQRLLTFETPVFRYARDFDQRVAFINREVEKVRAIPGVVGAASINLIPFTNSANATFYLLEGQSRSQTAGQVALIRNISRDYFTTVGAQLREGRPFTSDDRKSSTPVAIVNAQFAKRAYPGKSPLGQRFKFGSLGATGYWYTIVGVVNQIPESGILDETKPVVYRVYEQSEQISDLAAGIVVRTAEDPESIVPAVRQAIWSLDKNQPLAHIRTLDSMIDRQLSTSSESASLLGAFAALALVLASLGIYGVLSYAVAQRTNEIGVRMALGATASEILRSFTRQGLGLTMFGLAIGLAAGRAASRVLTTLLYGYQPGYFSTAAAVSLILIVVAALACLVPARRASRTDPMIALRQE